MTLQPTELQPRSKDSSCSAGCQDGWIYAGDAARACSCQRRRPSEFSQDYAPGGLNTTARRRAIGRRGGKASGRARRRGRAPRGPRRRRGASLALAYKIRQVAHPEFERLYERMCAAQGIRFNRGGLDTAYELYRADFAAYRAQGQDHETTNDQRTGALEKRGRYRGTRTVQRTRKRLGLMGLVSYHHVRRSGQRRIPGQMDSIRVQMRHPPSPSTPINVTPPYGNTNPLRGMVGVRENQPPREPENDLLAPPAAAETESPASPAGSDEAQSGGERSATPHPGHEEPDETPAPAPPVRALTREERQAEAELDFQRQLAFDEIKRQAGCKVLLRRPHRKPDWGERASL